MLEELQRRHRREQLGYRRAVETGVDRGRNAPGTAGVAESSSGSVWTSPCWMPTTPENLLAASSSRSSASTARTTTAADDTRLSSLIQHEPRVRARAREELVGVRDGSLGIRPHDHDHCEGALPRPRPVPSPVRACTRGEVGGVQARLMGVRRRGLTSIRDRGTPPRLGWGSSCWTCGVTARSGRGQGGPEAVSGEEPGRPRPGSGSTSLDPAGPTGAP